MLVYEDLNEEQRSFISNGCGPKGSFKVPDLLFKDACDVHDFYYWRGNTEEWRLKGDKVMLFIMRHNANKAVWWKRPFYHTMALVYFWQVRHKGWAFFNYEKEKTMDDLHREMGV